MPQGTWCIDGPESPVQVVLLDRGTAVLREPFLARLVGALRAHGSDPRAWSLDLTIEPRDRDAPVADDSPSVRFTSRIVQPAAGVRYRFFGKLATRGQVRMATLVVRVLEVPPGGDTVRIRATVQLPTEDRGPWAECLACVPHRPIDAVALQLEAVAARSPPECTRWRPPRGAGGVDVVRRVAAFARPGGVSGRSLGCARPSPASRASSCATTKSKSYDVRVGTSSSSS